MQESMLRACKQTNWNRKHQIFALGLMNISGISLALSKIIFNKWIKIIKTHKMKESIIINYKIQHVCLWYKFLYCMLTF